MTQIRPMLAAQKYREAGDLWGPSHERIVLQHLAQDGYLLGQPKWDGMRCCLDGGVARSRSWKPLANQALQQFAREHPELQGLDSEVFSGHSYAPESFRESMSGIRSGGGSGQLTMVYFDVFNHPELGYEARRREAVKLVGDMVKRVQSDTYDVILMKCPTVLLATLDDIYAYEAECIAQNFEGAIMRRPNNKYKYGRSTALGGSLVKVKRRNTVDARVIGYKQRFENHNEAKTSDLGYTVRSAHKEGKVPVEMLGALELELLDGSGAHTDCGVFRGLTHGDLADLWANRESLPGRYCEVSVDKATGGYDTARCPVWIRWRDAAEF